METGANIFIYVFSSIPQWRKELQTQLEEEEEEELKRLKEKQKEEEERQRQKEVNKAAKFSKPCAANPPNHTIKPLEIPVLGLARDEPRLGSL